ncbi:hypothetical protein Y032_0048g1670 [Ancylostoma ceylanicum]|uniref:Uncharacterized protein n=1 Tax=Ancylostoma ceylanicum TaxID=53326 RepID=A0A016UA71_9BILA|nr:hypothetical protein Y032_0048g1670 [Ancylostoma ceylanicum]
MRFFPHISGLMLAFNIIPSLCEISDDIEWCDLYSPIDKTRNDTMVIFHRIRSQYEKSRSPQTLPDDMPDEYTGCRMICLYHVAHKFLSPFSRGHACSDGGRLVAILFASITKTTAFILHALIFNSNRDRAGDFDHIPGGIVWRPNREPIAP